MCVTHRYAALHIDVSLPDLNMYWYVQMDIFSFGVLLWELVTGERAWQGYDAVAIAVLQGREGKRLALPQV